MSEPAQVIPFPQGFREGPFTFGATGLSVLGSPTFDQWNQAGLTIQTTYKGIHWIIGDWLLYGERAFGQNYAQAIDTLGFDYTTLRNDRRVCLRIEPERRRPELSFDHHLAVAELDPWEQEELLNRAVAQGWTRDKLRKAVKEHRLDRRRQEAGGKPPELIPLPGEPTPPAPAGNVNLIAGDFRTILPRLPASSIDLILSQPPQDGESIQTFADLAKAAYPILRDQGSLIVQAPTAHLGEVIILMGTYLRYWWTISIGATPRFLEGKGVATRWRPWVWLVKGGRRGDATINDALSEEPIRYLVERLTVEGEVILDPCCGTGEVLSAAHGLSRALIGVDRDPANVDIAKRRLGVSE